MRFLVPAVLFVVLGLVLLVRPPRIDTSMEALAGDAIESVPEDFRRKTANLVPVLTDGGAETVRLVRAAAAEFAAPADDLLDLAISNSAGRVTREDAELLATPEGRAKIARRRVKRLYSDPTPPIVSVTDDPFGLSENFLRSMASSGVVVLKLKDDVVADTDRLIEFKERMDSVPGPVSYCGVPMHTAAAAQRTKKEITILSAVSLVFIALLSVLVFKSVRWLCLLALSLLVSALAGAVALAACFSSVHLMTLVFGTTLLGLVIDYSFHWLMRPSASAADATRRNLVISWATTEVSLLPLLASSLPVMRQSAVFLGVGLAAALAFVIWCYPPCAAAGAANPESAALRRRFRCGFSVPHVSLALVCVLAVLAFGLSRLRFGTTPDSLYSPPPSIAAAERFLMERAGGMMDAPSSDPRTAADIARLYEEQGGMICEILGIEKPDFKLPSPSPSAAAGTGTWFAEMLTRWTDEALLRLGLSLGAMFLILAAAYGKRAPGVIAPSLAALAAVGAALGFMGERANLFHLLAAFLLIGMSLDYSVFLRGGTRSLKPAACSLATSLVGFGLLAFVSFPVVRAFGVALGIGLPAGFAAALLPSFFRDTEERAEHGATPVGMETLYLVYRVFGLRALEVLASVVGSVIWLFSPAVRRNSPSREKAANFARSLADKLVVMAEGGRLPEVVTDSSPDAAAFLEDVAEGRGTFVLSSHVGTIEVLSALGRTERTFHAWMEFDRTGVFNRFYLRHARRKKVVIHPISEFGAATVFEAGDALERGDALLMAADRTFGRTREVDGFTLAEGAFRFARAMDRSVYFVACVERSFGKYTAIVRRLDSSSTDAMARGYARTLAELAERYPLQHFKWETEK